MKGLQLHGSDVADRTASTYEMMHEATRCKEKEAELYFLNSTLASSLYSCPALPPLLLNLSLSLALSLCLSLRSHTQMHTRRKAVKSREGNGSGTMGIFCLRGLWGIRSTATESVRARVWVWVRVWECVGGACVSEWHCAEIGKIREKRL